VSSIVIYLAFGSDTVLEALSFVRTRGERAVRQTQLRAPSTELGELWEPDFTFPHWQ